MDQKSRAAGFSSSIRLNVRKTQLFLWLCQVQIQIKPLHVHKLFRPRCKLHPLIFKELSVHLCQDSSCLCVFWNISFIHSDKKQGSYILQSCTLHITNQNLIHAWRNQCNLCLRHSRFQNLQKLLRRNHLITKNLCHFIQKFHHDPKNLGIFLLHRLVSKLTKIKLLCQKFFLDPALYDEFIQTPAIFFHRFLPSGKPFGKKSHFFCELLTDLVDLFHLFRIHAPIDTHPFLLPFPDPPDSKRDHIILQYICFLAGNIRHSTAQITKYTLIAEPLNHHLQCRPEIFYKWIHKNGMLFINKIWNSGIFKDLPCHTSIFLKISGDHCNLTIMIILLSDQPQNSSGRFFHFLFRIPCRKNLNLLLLFLIDTPVITEQMLLQKIQGRRICKSRLFSRCDPDRFFHIFCKLCKRPDHLMTHIKQFMRFSHRQKLFSDIHGHCHRNLCTDCQKFPEDFHLDRCESCVTIQQNYTSLQFLRKRDFFCQNLQHFLRRHKMPGKIFPESLIQNLYILEFHLEKRFVLTLMYHLIQFFFPDLILHKL